MFCQNYKVKVQFINFTFGLSFWSLLSFVAVFSLSAPRFALAVDSGDHIFSKAQAKYKNVRVVQADFEQKQKNKTLGEEKLSSGKIVIKRPNSFKWETSTPDPSLLLCNGKKAWFYTPPFRAGEKGQVVIRNSADTQSQLAVDLLSGKANIAKSFVLKTLAPGHYELKPVKSLGNIERLELFIEKSSHILYKVMLFMNAGNETELLLKNIVLMGPKQAAQAKIDDKAFTFTIPANTEEIE